MGFIYGRHIGIAEYSANVRSSQFSKFIIKGAATRAYIFDQNQGLFGKHRFSDDCA